MNKDNNIEEIKTSTESSKVKNILLHTRLKLELSQQEMADKANVSLCVITQIENGNYKVPNVLTDTWYKMSEAYNMSISEFINQVNSNYKYKLDKDEIFLQELKNKKSVRKSTDVKPNRPENTYQKEFAKKLFNKALSLGFYNTADHTEYNRYCKENNITISVEEWHIIKKQLEEEFFNLHGMTRSQYKFLQSSIKCAREVGFGDDYRKYNRWKAYKKSHKNEMTIEEWSKYDDKKQAKAKHRSPEKKRKYVERTHNYNMKKVSELGLTDERQFVRWRDFCRFHKEENLSLEEWKKLDEVRLARATELQNMKKSINTNYIL